MDINKKGGRLTAGILRQPVFTLKLTGGVMEYKLIKIHDHWIYRRGDIYLVDLGPGSGSKQGGIRPVLNYQNNTANLHSTIISSIPITSKLKKLNLPCHVFIGKEGNLVQPSMVMAEQLVPVNKWQVLGYIGKLSKKTMEKIDQAVEEHHGRFIPHELEAP